MKFSNLGIMKYNLHAKAWYDNTFVNVSCFTNALYMHGTQQQEKCVQFEILYLQIVCT